ncbi:MAG: AAA family ATPase [bacterium]|nr:AAA family ATPase [bacterium]MDD5354535.1 AAA family ATPase [bacterium]MDD5756768.1 AAA family ATPase [bacterium]
MDCIRELELLINSHYPIVYFETLEEDRAETIINTVANNMGIMFFVWSATEGLIRKNYPEPVYDTKEPLKVLNHIGIAKINAIYLLKDLHHFIETPLILRKLKDVAQSLSGSKSTIIISAMDFKIPMELEKLIAHIRLALPNEQELKEVVLKTVYDFSRSPKKYLSIDSRDEILDRIVNNLKGLTLFEAEKALNKVILGEGKLTEENLGLVLRAKKEIVEKEGLLEYYIPEEGLTAIGGLNNLKIWLDKRKCMFTRVEEARSYGLQPPKGVLVIGVQGCGKSLFAKTVAKEWGLPLLKLDPGTLYNKYIGESEANLRRALSLTESIAPAVLWIDEIEKGFSYSANTETDAGVSNRIMGTFLSWLQDKKESVFVVATSNDISMLPPELLRKGRFDEIFFVDLPNDADRIDIFKIHFNRREFDPAKFDLEQLTKASEGFSGAEIEQSIISALYGAFSQKKELSTEIIMEEIRNTKPLSVTMSEKISFLREWAQERAVKA